MSSFSPASSSPVLHQKKYRTTHNYSNNSIRCCDENNAGSFNHHESNGGLALDASSSSFPEKNILANVKKKPPRPRRIILVRHGESLGNVDDSVYTRIADPKVGITQKGVAEAEDCGRKMKELIEKDGADDWKVYFYVSPYRRGIETLRNLAKVFERSRIAGVREEPRLREQDFGKSFYY